MSATTAERILVAGIDGGGSKTRAVIADGTGRTLATVDGPGSAVRPGQVAHSADVIAAVVRDALAVVLTTPAQARQRLAARLEAEAPTARGAASTRDADGADDAGAPVPEPEARDAASGDAHPAGATPLAAGSGV